MFDDHHHHHHDSGGAGCSCLVYCLLIMLVLSVAVFILGVAFWLFSLAWIPGIIFIVYLVFAKDKDGKRTLKIAIASILCVISFILFMFLMLDDSVHSIDVNWPAEEFDISETTQVEIIPSPDDAEIESVELEENDIAELTYENGQAIITFKATGSDYLHIIVNGDVRSSGTYIKVTDENAQETSPEQETPPETPEEQPETDVPEDTAEPSSSQQTQ